MTFLCGCLCLDNNILAYFVVKSLSCAFCHTAHLRAIVLLAAAVSAVHVAFHKVPPPLSNHLYAPSQCSLREEIIIITPNSLLC